VRKGNANKSLSIKEYKMYQVWDGDLYLYSVETEYEADEQAEAGFTVVGEPK